MDIRKKYWRQHKDEIYGNKPSISAERALVYLDNVKNLLEIGGAYGRNCRLFASKHIKVTNVDLCENWISLLEQTKLELPITNICADLLEIELEKTYDAVFSNLVFQCFKLNELDAIFQKTYQWLNNGGLFINSWLSDKDDYLIAGHLNSETYIHRFNRQELEQLHSKHGFHLEVITELQELELINAKNRKTTFWFTVARKKI